MAKNVDGGPHRYLVLAIGYDMGRVGLEPQRMWTVVDPLVVVEDVVGGLPMRLSPCMGLEKIDPQEEQVGEVGNDEYGVLKLVAI